MEKENVFLLILIIFDMYTFTDYILGDMWPSFKLECQNWQVGDSVCFCLCLYLDCILFLLFCAATWSTGQQNGMLPPSSHGLLAADAVHLSVPPAQHTGRLHPKVPWGGQDAALSRDLHAEIKMWRGGLQSPQLLLKRLDFRQPIWWKDRINGSDGCLKGKQEEVGDIGGSYITACIAREAQSLHVTKPRKSSFLLWRCHILQKPASPSC